MPTKRIYSRYILPFERIRPGDRVVLYVRVSRGSSSSASQLRKLRRALRNAGAIEVGVVVVQCSGYDNPFSEHRPWVDSLLDAYYLANQHEAKILASEADRFVRSYSISKNWKAEPTAEQFDELREWTHGVPLVSLLHPNTPPCRVRKAQSERGQGDNKGGRPRKRKPSRRQTYQNLVHNLVAQAEIRRLHAEGVSGRKIAAAVGYPHRTIGPYLRQAKQQQSAISHTLRTDEPKQALRTN